MGIDEYYNNFNQIFPNVTFPHSTAALPIPYDHVLIDINQALYRHPSSNNYSDHKAMQKALSFIKKIMDMCPPKKSLFISSDGPGIYY